MTRLKQQISTDTIFNKKNVLILLQQSTFRFGDLLLSIITFLLEVVSVDVRCFRGVIMSPYNCS